MGNVQPSAQLQLSRQNLIQNPEFTVQSKTFINYNVIEQHTANIVFLDCILLYWDEH